MIKYGLKLFGVAGSGKTTVCMKIMIELLGSDTDISDNLKKIIASWNITNLEINDIAFTSFTRAAISSIKEKITSHSNIILPRHSDSFIKTLNSITWKLSDFNIENQITNKEIEQFFKEHHISTKADSEEEKSEMDIIRELYSSLLNKYAKKLSDITDLEIKRFIIEDYSQKPDYQNGLSDDTIILALRLYDEWKITNKKMDYIDSIIYVLEHKIDLPVKVLIVDEAQDLSYAQTCLIDLWTKEFDKEIFIISGDDDQCVHQWIGATPEYLVEFDCPNMITYKLEQSHRVTKNVAYFCNNVLGTINYRKQKNIYSSKKDGIIDYHNLNLNEVSPFLEKLIKKNEGYFLLFRTNKTKRMVSDILFENTNIIFGMIGGQSRWNKKFVNICNALNKLVDLQTLTKDEVIYLFDVLPSRTCLIRGSKKKVNSDDAPAIFNAKDVLDMTLLWKTKIDLTNFDKISKKTSLKEEIIPYLKYVEGKLDTKEEIDKNESYKEKLKKIDYIINFKEDIYNKIIEYNIMLGTYHSSKGLESDNSVVFLGTSEYFKDIDDSERRCFYTACSRTKQNLHFIGSFNLEKNYLEDEFKCLINSFCFQ